MAVLFVLNRSQIFCHGFNFVFKNFEFVNFRSVDVRLVFRFRFPAAVLAQPVERSKEHFSPEGLQQCDQISFLAFHKCHSLLFGPIGTSFLLFPLKSSVSGSTITVTCGSNCSRFVPQSVLIFAMCSLLINYRSTLITCNCGYHKCRLFCETTFAT